VRAKKVVTMDGLPIENGAVAIDGNRITAVGPWTDLKSIGAAEIFDLGEIALLPGLINSHCHLDFTVLAGRLKPQRSFADWIRQIISARNELSSEDYLASISAGIAEARRWGTTSILNIESLPTLLSQMPRPSLRIGWFAELIDVQPRCSSEALVENTISFFEGKTDWLGGFGLGPHTPYTVSPELLRKAIAVAQRDNLRLTMHLAESAEEMQMFRDGCGPLFELLQGLGRSMEDCQAGKTPLAVALDHATLDERWVIAHLNELTEDDFERLARGPRFHIAHCPCSARYFQHQPFALRRLLDLGFNICLGTDSLASNSSLSLFAEMRALQHAHSWLEAQKILQMVTVNGARALGSESSLGRIRAGSYADLIAIPIEGGKDVYEQIIEFDQEVAWMLLDGQLCPKLR